MHCAIPFLLICLIAASLGCDQTNPSGSTNASDTAEAIKYEPDGEALLDAESATGFYVPQDLEEAIFELGRILGPAGRAEVLEVEEADMIRYHLGLGMWLRNEWGLWGGSRLAIYFLNRGITHPDNMSGIIFDSYWRYAHGKSIDFASQIEEIERQTANVPHWVDENAVKDSLHSLTSQPYPAPEPLPFDFKLFPGNDPTDAASSK